MNIRNKHIGREGAGLFVGLVLIIFASLLVSAELTGATTVHKSYPRSPAKTCKAGYVGFTEKHIVNGHERRYVLCVWTPKPAPVAVTTNPGGLPVGGITTTAPPVSTPPKPADPPTVLTITADINPAIDGQVVTYTVTVDHVLSPTTGALEVFDGLTQLTNCSVPETPTTPDANAEVSGSCTEAYPNVGTYKISGIFTGDATYAQAAATLTETVVASSPPITASSGGGGGGGAGAPVTTTTTLAPASTSTTVSIDVSSEQCGPGSGPAVQCTYRVTISASTTAGAQDVTSSGSYQWTITPQGTTSFNVTLNKNGTSATVSASATWSGDGYQSSTGSASAQVGPAT